MTIKSSHFAGLMAVAVALPLLVWSRPPLRVYAQTVSESSVTNICRPVRVAGEVVATRQQRAEAGSKAEPAGIVGPSGFDWSDTQLGVVKDSDDAFLFFGSDGSCHANCGDLDERDGSITRTVGALNNPLGEGAPMEAILPQSAEFRDNSVVYVGGGPVYRVPAGHPGAGNLLLVYGAARWTDLQQHTGNYGLTGLAKSTDDGLTWTDLGFIITANQRFIPGASPSTNEFDSGLGGLVPDQAGVYFYYYFPDKLANGGGFEGSPLTFFSVARVPMDELLQAAFDGTKLPSFKKYYNGAWDQPGLGGLSTSILNSQSNFAGDSTVIWSEYLKRYVVIFYDTENISYAESADGVHWAAAIPLLQESPNVASVLYSVPVGRNGDPNVLGQGNDPGFYVYYTYYPKPTNKGGGWPDASINRLEMSCAAGGQPNSTSK